MPSLESFSDIKEVLDNAIKARGGSYILPTAGAAIAWRQRANRFRKQWYTERRTNQYEYLILRLESNSATVKIEFRTANGQFVPTDTPAEFIPAVTEVPAPRDELDDAVDTIRERLNLE